MNADEQDKSGIRVTQADPFEREERYFVLKRRDVETALTGLEKEVLCMMEQKCQYARVARGKPLLQCLVVEHDWPEYEIVWRSIEERTCKERTCKASAEQTTRPVISDRDKAVWRAALTLAHNMCNQDSDRINADDGPLEAVRALSDEALRIRGWLEPSDAQLLEMFVEAGILDSDTRSRT